MPRFIACEHKTLSIGQPCSPHMMDRIIGERFWLSRRQWQHGELSRDTGWICHCPSTVGRQRKRKPSPNADGRRSVRPANVDFIIRTGRVSTFGEQDGFPVMGDVLYLR